MDDLDLARIRAIADRAEILDCITRYCRGMDRLDRDLVRSAYHDDAVDDHVAFVGPVEGFIDWAFGYHGTQVRHQHHVTNHTVDIDGDTAHAETYYLFIGTEQDEAAPLTVTGGRYLDRFERRDGRWAIAARLCLVEWRTEATSLLTGPALDVIAVSGTIARDGSDSSYARPLTVRPYP
ncbi:MAG TPA: nuclear transport factor 2 family protein [Acidimicrobiales bacterium]|nr:nuclear transport factor 2 family protein [Acidimicrobiales bacterium]